MAAYSWSAAAVGSGSVTVRLVRTGPAGPTGRQGIESSPSETTNGSAGAAGRIARVVTSAATAAREIDRAVSTSTYMSAIRCLRAWNEPMVRPNCLRDLV